MSRHRTALRVMAVSGAVAALVALWIFPSLVFPSPGANDAPILWTLPMPIVAITLVASLAAVIRSRARHEPVTAPVALATYLTGVAVAFAVGLFAVANLENDRFWPFLLSPVVFAPAGIVLLALALSGRGARSEIVPGVVIGVLAAIFLAAWIVSRGASDWLLAPYGFDVCLLITIEAAFVYIVGSWRLPSPRPVTG